MNKDYLRLLKADKSSWVDQHCSIPFQNIMINARGDLYSCWCEAWLPHSIGNIMDVADHDDFMQLFNNNPVRDSILDRSHKFCRANICSNLQSKFNGGTPHEFVTKSKLLQLPLSILRISMDSSCNLSCHSCRHEVIINHQKPFVQKLQDMLDRIDSVFFNPRRVDNVFMDGIGEFLASKTLFNWMLSKSDSGIRFWLQTNGTLISQHRDKIAQILRSTDFINVSIDASYKELFEHVRRGGNWNKLMEGLELLNELRPTLGFRIRYNFTIGQNNYHDVPGFIEFTKRMQPDSVFYSKIERWGHLSDDQWKSVNVFSKDHPDNAKLVEILTSVEWPDNTQKNFEYKI